MCDGAAARGESLVGLDADEGVAADAFAALDGLEEEGFGLFGVAVGAGVGAAGAVSSGETQEGAYRGFEIGDEGAVDRDEGVLAGEGAEVWFGRRRGGRHGLTQFTALD